MEFNLFDIIYFIMILTAILVSIEILKRLLLGELE